MALRRLCVPVSVLLLDGRSVVVKHTCEQLVFLVKVITRRSVPRASSEEEHSTVATVSTHGTNGSRTTNCGESNASGNNNNNNNVSNTNNPCRLLLKDLLPTILLLHAQTLKVKQTYACDMMQLLIPTCPFRTGIPIILERMRNDASHEVRRICLFYITLILRHWTSATGGGGLLGEYITPSMRLRIGNGVARAFEDASGEVREEARVAFGKLRKVFPVVWDGIVKKTTNGVLGGGSSSSSRKGGIRVNNRKDTRHIRNITNKKKERRTKKEEGGYTSDNEGGYSSGISYDSLIPVVGLCSQNTIESIQQLTSSWNNSIHNVGAWEEEEEEEEKEVSLSQYQQQAKHGDNGDDDGGGDGGGDGGSDIFEGIFNTTDNESRPDVVLVPTTSTASTVLEDNRTTARFTLNPTTITTLTTNTNNTNTKTGTTIYSPIINAIPTSILTKKENREKNPSITNMGTLPVVSTTTLPTTDINNNNNNPLAVAQQNNPPPAARTWSTEIRDARLAMATKSNTTTTTTADDAYHPSPIVNPVPTITTSSSSKTTTTTTKKEDARPVTSIFTTSNTSNDKYSPTPQPVTTTFATIPKKEDGRPVTSIFTPAPPSSHPVTTKTTTTITTTTTTKKEDARIGMSPITIHTANDNNYSSKLHHPVTITTKPEPAFRMSPITINTANDNYPRILNPATTPTITTKNEEVKIAIPPPSASTPNEINDSPQLFRPAITTINEDSSSNTTNPKITTTTTNLSFSVSPSTPKTSLSNRTTDGPKLTIPNTTTSGSGGNLPDDGTTTETVTTATTVNDDILIVAEELDSAHELYIKELIAKLRLEMNAMNDFNSVIARAKEGGIRSGSACSSAGYNTVGTPSSTNGNSQEAEITEDEVLMYFETIYNFLDELDDNNRKLRTAMDEIGNTKDSNGDSRPYSRDRRTTTAVAVLPVELPTTIPTMSWTDSPVMSVQLTIDEADEEETQNSDDCFIEPNGSQSPLNSLLNNKNDFVPHQHQWFMSLRLAIG